MATIYDVNPNDLIEEVAKELKPMLKAPDWATFVKTGRHKERPPTRDDWWHIRAAAILRAIEMMGPIGTSKLRAKYGGKKNRGHKTEHTFKGSGAIIRKILQQLDEAGFTKQAEIGHHKGRVITPKGHALLDKVASELPAHTIKEKALKTEEPRPRAEMPIRESKPKSDKPAGERPAGAPKPKPQKKENDGATE
jgi:small subunit ribosomal protein S19e